MMTTEQRTNETSGSAQPTGIESLLGTGDHKPVGRLWISAGSFFLVASLGLSLLAAFEAVDLSGFQFVAETDAYVQVGSLAQELLLFGAIVPIIIGLAVYLVPLQVGSSSLAFPRGAAAAFWTWLLGCGLLIAAYLANGGPGGGRTDFVELWIMALSMIVIAIIWTLVCIATTVFATRAEGMTMARVPATSWSFLVFSLVGILSLPITLAELLISYVRFSGGYIGLANGTVASAAVDTTTLANVVRGVQAVPSLYWLAIPVLGIAVDVASSGSGKPVKSHQLVLGAIGLFGIVSFGSDIVGFATVREPNYDNTLFILGMIGAVLPVLLILGLLAPKLKPAPGSRRSVSPFATLLSGLLLLLSVSVALLGIIEPLTLRLADLGVSGADPTATLVLNGTTFDEGIRAGIFGSLFLALVASLNHWSVKIWGRYLNQAFLSLATLLFFAGSSVWMLGRVGAGFDDQLAFPATELTGGGSVEWFNLLAAFGVAGATAGAVLLFLSAATGRSVGHSDEERWTGLTLEWLTESPPSLGNFTSPPVVSSANPAIDAAAQAAVSGSESEGQQSENAESGAGELAMAESSEV